MSFNLERDYKIAMLREKLDDQGCAMLNELLGLEITNDDRKNTFCKMILLDFMMFQINGAIRFTHINAVEVASYMMRHVGWLLGNEPMPEKALVGYEAALKGYELGVLNLTKTIRGMDSTGGYISFVDVLENTERERLIKEECKDRVKVAVHRLIFPLMPIQNCPPLSKIIDTINDA